MTDILEAMNIQWHPGFYGAAELEFRSNKGDLLYKRLGETVDQIPANELTISICN